MDARVAVGFVLGLLVGGLGMWLLSPAAEPPGPSDLDAASDARSPTAGHGPALERAGQPSAAPQAGARPSPPATGAAAMRDAAAAPATARTSKATAAPASTEELIRARADSIRVGSALRIDQLEAQRRDADAIARRQVEAELAAEAARLADLERGGLLDLVRKLDRDWVSPQGLLTSPERFGAFFERKARGGTLDPGRANASPDSLSHGDTIRVPAGRWPLDVQGLNRASRSKGYPRDLLIEGAGMDQSLLVLNDEFDVSTDVVNLTFRDLTIHADDNYVVQFRQGFTLRLERCRVIGFDMGAGGSTAFNGRDGALYATGCRIEAGFGKSPWRGNLWRVNGVFLARLEDCTIVGPIGDLDTRRNGLIVYDRVQFVDLEAHERKKLEHGRGVRLIDCRFEHAGDPLAKRFKRDERDVAELNPAWADAKKRRR